MNRFKTASYPHNSEIFQNTNLTPGRIDQGEKYAPARAIIAQSNQDVDDFSAVIAQAAGALIPGAEIDGAHIYNAPEATITAAIVAALGIQPSKGHGAARIDGESPIDARAVFSAIGVELVFTDEYLDCDDCGIYYKTTPDMYDDDPSTRIMIHPDGFGICHACAGGSTDGGAFYEAYAAQWQTLAAYKGAQGHVPDYAGTIPSTHRRRFYVLKDYGRGAAYNDTASGAARAIVAAGLTARGQACDPYAGPVPVIREARYNPIRFYRYMTVYTATVGQATALRDALHNAGMYVTDTPAAPSR